ncbi:Holliday junction branch migration protein RuvA [Nibricoccus sp. IMCC34717]|uniref:Holliday junction branch migration protein RuvA n=1 Tax=Nibricoccus sp. IMCC34717 TaxID=3034021 RepID=UPI00384E56A6
MITSIQGTLVESTPLRAVIETHGLGYEVLVPVTTAEKLPAPGTTVKLHTQAIYREDSQTLYGFATTEERDFFRLLIENVTGVGPKMALSIMSKLSLHSLEAAIRDSDIALLAKCPGIGKKTAERLVIELRGKVGGLSTAGGATSGLAPAPGTGGSAGSVAQDAVLALMALGYKAPDADAAVRRALLALGPKATTEAVVKRALVAE